MRDVRARVSCMRACLCIFVYVCWEAEQQRGSRGGGHGCTAAAPRVALRDECAACLLLHTTLGLAGASTCTSCLAGTYSSAGASRVCLISCPLFPARHNLQTYIPCARLHACMLVCYRVTMGPSPRCCGRSVGGCATTATAPAARTMLIEAMAAITHTLTPRRMQSRSPSVMLHV